MWYRCSLCCSEEDSVDRMWYRCSLCCSEKDSVDRMWYRCSLCCSEKDSVDRMWYRCSLCCSEKDSVDTLSGMLDVGLLWNAIVSSVYTYVLFSLPCYFYKAFQKEVSLSIDVALPNLSVVSQPLVYMQFSWHCQNLSKNDFNSPL